MEDKPYHIQYGNKIEVFKRYQVMLDHLDTKLIEIANLKKMLNQFAYDMKQKESKHMFAITNEVDSGNVPKFKNDTSRRAELNSRLRNDPEYKKLFDANEDTSDQLLDAELKLQSIKAHLKFYEVNS